MSHLFLIDRIKHTWDDNAIKLKNHIDTHKLNVEHFVHSMVVASNSLSDLQHIAEQFFGTIIANFRLYIISPIESLFQRSATSEKLPSLDIMGRYSFTDSNSYGDGIVVANIDDGVYEKHPEFRDRYLGYWFGINSNTGVAELRTSSGEWVSEHGTHTMGTLCGKTVGFAPNAKFTFLKLFNSEGADLGDMFKLVDLCLAKFKENPVAYPLPHVFNCSFGSDIPPNTDLTDPTFIEYASALQHMYESVKPYGSLFMFAAGNSGASGNPIELPSFFNNSFSVGSLAIKDGNNFQLSRFSSYGTCIESNDASNKISNSCPVLVCPGEDILSSVPLNYSLTGYASLSGSSMATPASCGVIASMFSFLIAKGLTRLQAYQRIRAHLCNDASYRKAPVGSRDGYGRGLLQYSTFATALLEGQ